MLGRGGGRGRGRFPPGAPGPPGCAPCLACTCRHDPSSSAQIRLHRKRIGCRKARGWGVIAASCAGVPQAAAHQVQAPPAQPRHQARIEPKALRPLRHMQRRRWLQSRSRLCSRCTSLPLLPPFVALATRTSLGRRPGPCSCGHACCACWKHAHGLNITAVGCADQRCGALPVRAKFARRAQATGTACRSTPM
jgi:hypothetical protein